MIPVLPTRTQKHWPFSKLSGNPSQLRTPSLAVKGIDPNDTSTPEPLANAVRARQLGRGPSSSRAPKTIFPGGAYAASSMGQGSRGCPSWLDQIVAGWQLGGFLDASLPCEKRVIASLGPVTRAQKGLGLHVLSTSRYNLTTSRLIIRIRCYLTEGRPSGGYPMGEYHIGGGCLIVGKETGSAPV